MSINLSILSVPKVGQMAAIAAVMSLVAMPSLAGEKSQKTTQPMSSDAVSQPMTTDAKPAAMPAADSAAETKANTAGTILDIASSNQSFTLLTAAVKAAGLTETLSGEGPYTVFAPTDQAFAALPQETVAMLMKPENKAKLQKVLTYHVVPGSVESSTLKPGTVQSVEGAPINVKMMEGKVMVNDANVTTPDIKASNGVIHVIDKVILPPDL